MLFVPVTHCCCELMLQWLGSNEPFVLLFEMLCVKVKKKNFFCCFPFPLDVFMQALTVWVSLYQMDKVRKLVYLTVIRKTIVICKPVCFLTLI